MSVRSVRRVVCEALLMPLAFASLALTALRMRRDLVGSVRWWASKRESVGDE